MKLTVGVFLFGAAVLVNGCATKNYVRNSVTPVQGKVDQVSTQAAKQGQEIAQTQQDVARNTQAISATDEKATAADARAGEALAKANQVDQKADQNARDLGQLRETIANLDDYKVVNQATVLFGLNRWKLTDEDKQQLDQLASSASGLKRFFIAIEGYTDQTGTPDYNLELSKRRADSVVQYLAGQRDVDFNHIHTIGFGEQKPADTGKGRDARAHNRRVEVQIYSADNGPTTQSTVEPPR